MELIFEIGCEELPSRFVEPALDQIKTAFIDGCADARLDGGLIELLATPRRLTLRAAGLPKMQDDLEEERTGPPANIAYDDDGNPTAAAQGFARGQGVDPDALYTVETEKGEYLAAKVFEKGQATTDLLPEILSDVIENLRFPKSMRWGSNRVTFGRPVRWILALADGEVVPLEFAGVKSGNTTFGHRFAAPGPIELGGGDDYVETLADAHVSVDPAQRRERIEAFLDEHGQGAGGQVVDDPALVDEVVYLVEKPHAVTLNFDPDYLQLPREVLISSMRSHQRYFAVEENDGSALRPACVVIYNTPVHDPQVVAHGNLKVLRARLDDARFFWDKDLQAPLSEHRKKLRDVIWIGSLGTVYDRTERMSQLAERIGEAMKLEASDCNAAARAAALSKADLVTQVVQEFPDLQGVMGREYALKSGESEAVAAAIDEQYLPDGADGELPKTDVGACVALAEKLDAIVGCFGIDMVPTSTSDPYGLRRAALGILQILRDRRSTVALADLVDHAISVYATDAGPTPFDDDKEVAHQVLDFLVTRLRYLLDGDAPTDVIQSVIAAGVDDIPSVYGRVEALTALRGEADFEPLALGFKRVVNILEKQADHLDIADLKVDPSLLKDPSEQSLFEATNGAEDAVRDHLENRKWDAACEVLIALKQPIDEFFDSVMVMSDDEALRHNRIALLGELKRLFLQVADISKIQT